MCSKIKCMGFFVLVIIASLLFAGSASAGDEWGYWSDLVIKYKLNERLYLKFLADAQFRDDAKDFFWHFYRFGFIYKTYDFLDLGLLYQYSRFKSTTGKWSDENRLITEGTLKWKMGGLNFSSKNKMEIRFLGDNEKLRYRNEFKIQKPVTFLGMKLFPYVSDEVFYDFKTDKVHMNWVSFGFFKKINKNLGINLFYVLQSIKKGSHWSERDYIGTAIVVSF